VDEPYPGRSMWWRDAVVYQIYPRSFQDSDGDGIGDLRGIARRLDHLSYLGVDALWLSPIYPSALADFGYDVSDYTDVDPAFGTLAELDGLIGEAHRRGLRLLLDLVPSHTSIEHAWFREHPDWYIWSPVDGPPNNWKAAFAGPAWSRDEETGRWYLHTFYPEQPDLDWRNPDVVAAMQNVVRFWLDRGVDGFRVDAVNVIVKDAELRDDPPASGNFPLPPPRCRAPVVSRKLRETRIQRPRGSRAGEPASLAFRRRIAFVCSCETRDSVTPSTSPISRRVSSS
jgi:alpha-glucosidase